MKNPKHYNEHGVPYSWNNLNFKDRSISVVTVLDIIEDAKNGAELVRELGKINMVHNTWVVDKETDTRVRIKHVDTLGNVTYIDCEKEKEKKVTELEDYKLSDVSAYIINKIATEKRVSKTLARKLFINAISYNVVVAAIMDQVEFLMEEE